VKTTRQITDSVAAAAAAADADDDDEYDDDNTLTAMATLYRVDIRANVPYSHRPTTGLYTTQ